MPTKTDTHAVTCPTCGTKYRSVNIAARRVQCGRCGSVFYDWYKPLLIGKGYDKFLSFKGRFCVCKGSRGSKKSKTAALWHIMMMMQYPEANTLVVRKTERTLKDSCFADLRWAIHRLGCDNEWKCTTNPLEITRVATWQKILFRGFDDPLKITSITVPTGYLCFCWIEEAYQITKKEDFETLNESIRGQMPPGYFKRFTITFNPWNDKHWLKKRFFDTPNDENKLSMTTDYRCNEWLDDADKKVFEDMIKEHPKRARVAAFGNWGVAEGLIYDNWQEYEFDLEAVKKIPGIKGAFGLDFGYSLDPSAFICALVDNNEKRVYIFDELYEKNLTNPDIAAKITEMGYRKERIVADSAEPKSIEELRQAGLINIKPSRKGADSIRNGISLCQEYKVFIHPRCVNFITEISNYCWDTDKFGNTINKPVDDFNHGLDAWRYGMQSACQGERFSWD